MVVLHVTNTTKFSYTQLRDMICRRLVGSRAFKDNDIMVSDDRQEQNIITITLGGDDCRVKADLELTVSITDLVHNLPSIEDFTRSISDRTAKIKGTLYDDGFQPHDVDPVLDEISGDVSWYLDEFAAMSAPAVSGPTIPPMYPNADLIGGKKRKHSK